MSTYTASIVVACATLVYIALTYGRAILIKLRSKLPPTLAIPTANQQSDIPSWSLYANAAVKLGPLITIPSRFLAAKVIVVNSSAAARELLERRCTFAGRPRSHMAELMGRQNNVGFASYGDRLKQMRRAIHATFNEAAVTTQWSNAISQHSLRLMYSLAASDSATSFAGDIERNIQNLITYITYGRKPDDEEYFRKAHEVMKDTFIGLQPNRWLVDAIPAIGKVPTWLPGTGFKRWALNARKRFNDLTATPFHEVEALLRTNAEEASSSFVSQRLQSLPENHTQNDVDVIRYAAGSIFGAGSDTMSAFLLTFILMLVRNPEIADRAYDEVYHVVGPGRLPDFADRDALPFVNAIIQEVHRFNPVVPLATHSNYKAEEYEGYYIPQHSWILGNIWAMTHEESLYHRPNDFNPERFVLNETDSQQVDSRKFTYGFGRRRCPGRYLADSVLYMYTTRLIFLFKFVPVDEASLPPVKFTKDFVSTPEPFRCRFTLRRGAAELMVSAQTA